MIKGVLYLYMKTIERAHTPAHMWERVKLSNNYSKALEQVCSGPKINRQLDTNPCRTDRQRVNILAKLHNPQMQTAYHQNYPIPHQDASHEAATTVRTSHRITIILIANSFTRHRPKLIGVKKKLDRREAVRERKALSAAHLERSIEKELIERLKSKAYGDAPLNVNETVWQAILDREKKSQKEKLKGDVELELEDDETDEEELEDELEEEDWGGKEFVSDLSGEEDGLSDLEDAVVRGLVLRLDMCTPAIYVMWNRIPGMTNKTSPSRATRTETRMFRSKKPRPHSGSGKQHHQHLHPTKRNQKRSPRVSVISYSTPFLRAYIPCSRRTKSRSGIRARAGECPSHPVGGDELVESRLFRLCISPSRSL